MTTSSLLSVPNFRRVTVDRMSPPAVQWWQEMQLHSDLVPLGPASYDPADILVRPHATKNSAVLYMDIKNSGDLPRCMSLHDGEALVRAPEIFRAVFAGKVPLLWRSAARMSGKTWVPYVKEEGGRVLIDMKHVGTPILSAEVTYVFAPGMMM